MKSQSRLHGFAAVNNRPVRRPRKDDVHASACHVVSYAARLHCTLLPYKTTLQSQARLHGFAACAIRAPDRPRHDLAKMTCTLPFVTSFGWCKITLLAAAIQNNTQSQWRLHALRRVRCGGPTSQFADLAKVTCTLPLSRRFVEMQYYIVHCCLTKRRAKPSVCMGW